MGDKEKLKSSSVSKSKAKTRYRRASRDIIGEEGMGKPKTEGLILGKERKKRERWLLTRKTWRYMADAGRKLIPDGAHNRPEDIPKIEAYFQEVCHREPRFLLWRKQSYPGALGFRNRGRSRGGRRKIGGSCRDKTSSADEADDIKQQQKDTQQKPAVRPSLLQLKQEFLFGRPDDQPVEKPKRDALVDNVLSHFGDGSSKTLDHQELLDRLTAHLASLEIKESQKSRSDVQGDSTQQKLIDTLRRYYSRSTNRDKVISDILTDRRLLHRLYFELRRTRGFIGGRPGSSNTGSSSGFGSTLSSGQWRRSEFVEEDEDAEAEDEASPWSSPPEVRFSPEPKELDAGTQTETIPATMLANIEEEVKRQIEVRRQEEIEKMKQQQQQQDPSKQGGRRSSVDNDDISPSVSDTIKRYLRMARKKSIDSDKIDRFKRINYDRTLRNIKPAPEDPISKDDGFDKGCQTEDTWVSAIKQLKLPDIIPQEEAWSDSSPPPTSKSILSSGQTFLSNLFHGLHHSSSSSSVAAAGVMQKSKSSSSVVQQGTRLVAKKMWKSRSKSQTRATPTATSTWTSQGNCVWTNVTGRSVVLEDTPLLQLTDIERRVLQKVALAKLQALNLGVAIRTPSETSTSSVQKPKRRPPLLKRKAITTGIFDTGRKEHDKDKGEGGGLVFGIPLGQCVENERAARLRAGQGDDANQLRRKSQYGSRTSFTSLIETPRSGEEKGSCESLISPTLSMPGLLDTLSCGSTQDLSASEGGVPNIVATCLRHLEIHGIHTLGIFRVSSSKKRVRQLREDFDCGKESPLDAELCPHDVATLLKEYFRDLPDSLLCKDLYPAFIQTQRIRNRRLQHEALQDLIYLLPVPNRDTLWALLNLLSLVASNSTDHRDSTGEWTEGNKMDSNNLATLFAPNILYSNSTNKSLKDEMSAEKSEERADAINVIRSLIDNYKDLYQVPAEVLDEVYIHMMDSHPELLDVLLRRRDVQIEELGDERETSLVSEDISDRLASHITVDSDEHVSSEDVRVAKERIVWSREAFTHGSAGMGGPDVEVRPRHKERGRERIFKKRWRDESSTRRKGDSDTGSNTPSRRASATGQGSEDNYSSDQINSSRGSLDSGAITAVLKIPVPSATSLALNLDDSDIPFIEDNERQQISLSMVRTTSSSSQRTRSHSGSDSSQASTQIHQIHYQAQPSGPGYDSAVGSSAALSSPPRITTPSASSYSSGGVYSSPPSWASSPPTSPDGLITVNYIPEEPTTARISIPTKKSTDSRQVILQRVTVKSAGEVQHVKSSYIQPSIVPEPIRRRSKDNTYRLLSSGSDSGKVSKSASSSSIITYPSERIIPIVKESDRITSADRKVTTSISNIGGAVLRSKTADIERMIKVNTSLNTSATKSQTVKKVSTTTSSISTALDKEEDKKQTKRRYTDVRHQTRHLTTDIQGETAVQEPVAGSTQTMEPKRAIVWKRREIISSEPKERKSYV